MSEQGTNRIFILGSCVSRDAFRLPGHDFELSGYIARTSLASALQSRPAPPAMLALAGKIQSSFQRRMVETDLNKRAADKLREAEFDILLLDLIDERFNLARFAGPVGRPSLVTLSAEFNKIARWSGPIVAAGSNQHFFAWREGVRQLLRVVPPSRIVVNRAYWARHTEDGTPLPRQEHIRANNAMLDTMYDFLERNGVFGVIDYPCGFLASPSHHWGLAPFHYVERIYRHMLGRLAELSLARRTSDAACNSSASHEHPRSEAVAHGT